MYPFALTNLSLAHTSYLLQSGLCPLALLCAWAVKFSSFPGISNKALPQLQEIHLLYPRLEETHGTNFPLPANLDAAIISIFLSFLFL